MKLPHHPNVALLESAVEAMFKIYLLRGDCSRAARGLLERHPADVTAVEECARLDETLAKAFRLLQTTLSHIQKTRGNRQKPTR